MFGHLQKLRLSQWWLGVLGDKSVVWRSDFSFEMFVVVGCNFWLKNNKLAQNWKKIDCLAALIHSSEQWDEVAQASHMDHLSWRGCSADSDFFKLWVFAFSLSSDDNEHRCGVHSLNEDQPCHGYFHHFRSTTQLCCCSSVASWSRQFIFGSASSQFSRKQWAEMRKELLNEKCDWQRVCGGVPFKGLIMPRVLWHQAIIQARKTGKDCCSINVTERQR